MNTWLKDGVPVRVPGSQRGSSFKPCRNLAILDSILASSAPSAVFLLPGHRLLVPHTGSGEQCCLLDTGRGHRGSLWSCRQFQHQSSVECYCGRTWSTDPWSSRGQLLIGRLIQRVCPGPAFVQPHLWKAELAPRLNSKFSPQIREQFHKTKLCAWCQVDSCHLQRFLLLRA